MGRNQLHVGRSIPALGQVGGLPVKKLVWFCVSCRTPPPEAVHLPSRRTSGPIQACMPLTCATSLTRSWRGSHSHSAHRERRPARRTHAAGTPIYLRARRTLRRPKFASSASSGSGVPCPLRVAHQSWGTYKYRSVPGECFGTHTVRQGRSMSGVSSVRADLQSPRDDRGQGVMPDAGPSAPVNTGTVVPSSQGWMRKLEPLDAARWPTSNADAATCRVGHITTGLVPMRRADPQA